MLKNYLTIAWRNFIKNKTFSYVNLSGLAIGLASVIIIMSYVRYELSYDKHYSNAKRAYRLVQERNKGGVADESVLLPDGLVTTLKKEFAEVESVTYSNKNKFTFLHKNEAVTVDAVTGDSSFLGIFNFPLVYGNRSSVLRDKFSVVITENIAETFFANQNPLGEKIITEKYDGTPQVWTITAVIKDIPANTHFKADVIISRNSEPDNLNWKAYSSLPQYILLNEKTNIQQLDNKLAAVYSKYNFPKEITIKFQPVTSIHLHSNIADEPFINSDIRFVYIFSLVALLILLIACINYINLTTARSLQRVKEVGVRKVLGAERNQLSIQFIGEAFLFFCMALPFAFFIAHLFWPLFTRILNIDLPDSYLTGWQNIVLISVVSIISGILSSLYPSFFLSNLQPITILRDWQKSFRFSLGLRKTLIVVQFFISVTLIIATIVMYKQLHFINHMQLGFNKEHLIVLPWHNFKNKSAAFKSGLKQNSNVKSVTTASWDVGTRYGGSASMDDPNDSTKEVEFSFVDGDFDFIKTMQIKLLKGRDFSSSFSSDRSNIDSILNTGKYQGEDYLNTIASRSIIISKNTARVLKLKDPIGQTLKFGALQGTVIGIIKDFEGLSLHQETPPLVVRASSEARIGYTYIRIHSQNIPATLEYIKQEWKRFFPGSKFDFSFVDERLQKLYDSERRVASLFTIFAILAICIACLGLFSLVALAVQQRTKEIGIRKVLGASVIEIAELISKDFLILVLIAIITAIPVSWWAMNKWLEDFAYKVNISWWIFVLAGMSAVLIALLTVSFQAIKAAVSNPVKSLRTE